MKPAFSADSGSGNDSRVSRASLSRSSITALVWSAVERWGGQLVALAVYMVLARMLGPDDFGLLVSTSHLFRFLLIRGWQPQLFSALICTLVIKIPRSG